MKTFDWRPDDRRDFLRTLTRSTLGVTFAGGLGQWSSTGVFASAAPQAKAKRIIYLFMEGAMTHLDTFDPKVGVAEAGETKPMATAVAGIQYSERFPKLAKLAGAIAVVRSLTTETGDHEGGKYLMRTAYKKLNSIQHPSMGAWMLDRMGRENKQLPGNFLVGNGNRHPGAGFLSPSFGPVPIAKPENGLSDVDLPKYMDERLFDRRLHLASRFDQTMRGKVAIPAAAAYDELYREARALMGSEDLAVFDLSTEPDTVRDAYGEDSFGQGCLLARRLCQVGARFVEVNLGGWDMHQDLYARLDEQAAIVDSAVSSLLRDLHANGLLEETLVVLTTEFGRKPNLNANAGRDHHPGAFSSLLAGAGIAAGQVYGASDKRGHSVDRDAVTPSDFNRTIAAAAGLPLEQEFFAPNGRPFKIGGDGSPVQELLA